MAQDGLLAQVGFTSDPHIAGKAVASGTETPTDGSATVVTGLSVVDSCVASFDGDPVITCMFAHADKGDQAGAPAAGSILIVTTKPTDPAGTNSDILPIAATTPFVDVNWIAVGDA